MPHGFGAGAGIGAGIGPTTSGTKDGTAIDYGAGGRTVAVDAVGAGAQHGNVVSRYLFGAGEGELLVASADATVADGHGHLAAGDQADARYGAAQFAQTVEQVGGGFVVGPVVAGVIDFNGETGAGGGYGSFIDGHFVREHGPPARADESGIVGFWRLVESMLTEKIGYGFGELIDKVVFGGDALAVMDGSGIGHGGAGGERVGCIVGHVGDKNRNLLGGIGCLGEASALDGGEMFADGVDLGDGCAGVHERAVGGGEVGQRDFVVFQSVFLSVFHSNDGLFDDGRAAAGDHEDGERSGVERSQRLEDGVGGVDGFGGRRGMPAAKIPETAHLAGGFDGRCDNAFEAAAELGFESGGHGVRRLPDGDDEDALVGIEIVQVVADAQDTALAVHVAGEGAFDGGVLERGGEDLAGDVAHVAELLFALWE